MIQKLILFLTIGSLLSSCFLSKRRVDGSSSLTNSRINQIKIDTVKDETRLYSEIVTDKTITQKGLFKIHFLNNRYYFEIADTLLNRDILTVTRISKGSFNGTYTGYAGDLVSESIIRFKFNNSIGKLFIEQISVKQRSDDSTKNGMYNAVQNSNFQPFVAAFDVKAFVPDSSGIVVDLTNYINSDPYPLFFSPTIKVSRYGLGGYHPDKSYIGNIQCFPENIEIRTVKTFTKVENKIDKYVSTSNLITLELNTSFLLLPKNMMKARHWDSRVGYFATWYINYDLPPASNTDWVVLRWRLEPKDDEIEKYKNGILVEPKKPIMFYIDPATPKKWVPYLIKAVNSWQQAFECAGFKKAIYALEVLPDDSSWNIDDARHSVIVYKASPSQEPKMLSFPEIYDPRSGEILGSHIYWYHNILELLRNKYIIQAGANDVGARTLKFDDSLMGLLIQYACTREVGHSLGLQNNFLSSWLVPVDSLRNLHYVKNNGIQPSIMDDLGFNYVAQPEDSFDRRHLIPEIGVYDKWAIKWGYGWPIDSATAEESYLINWTTNTLRENEKLVFGTFYVNPDPALRSTPSIKFDPACQEGDLGNDATKASRYGIKNLKAVVPWLEELMTTSNKDYESLASIYSQVVFQYEKYLSQVAINIGARIHSEIVGQDAEKGLRFNSKARQKAAVEFLQREAFSEPCWLFSRKIFRLSAGQEYTSKDGYMSRVHLIVAGILGRLISKVIFSNLMLAQNIQPGDYYSIDEFLADLEEGIWRELDSNSIVTLYRRYIQRVYSDRLVSLLKSPNQLDSGGNVGEFDDEGYSIYNTDAYSIVKRHVKRLIAKIDISLPKCKDNMTKYHLLDTKERLLMAIKLSIN